MDLELAKEIFNIGPIRDDGTFNTGYDEAKGVLSGWNAAVKKAAEIARAEEEPDENPSEGIRAIVSINPVLSILSAVRATKQNISEEILKLSTGGKG